MASLPQSDQQISRRKRGGAKATVLMARQTPRTTRISSMATAAAVSNKFESFFETTLADADPEIFGAIRNELGRQRHEIE
ncbi:MAG: hypothetical protein E5X59_10110, partial [Mesorhizobium sp.]